MRNLLKIGYNFYFKKFISTYFDLFWLILPSLNNKIYDFKISILSKYYKNKVLLFFCEFLIKKGLINNRSYYIRLW